MDMDMKKMTWTGLTCPLSVFTIDSKVISKMPPVSPHLSSSLSLSCPLVGQVQLNWCVATTSSKTQVCPSKCLPLISLSVCLHICMTSPRRLRTTQKERSPRVERKCWSWSIEHPGQACVTKGEVGRESLMGREEQQCGMKKNQHCQRLTSSHHSEGMRVQGVWTLSK